MDKTYIIVLIGRVLQIGLSLVSVRMYTTFLSSSEVGNLYLINTFVNFFGLCLINPVGMYINRKLHKWTDDKTVLNYFFILNVYLVSLSLFSIAIVYLTNRFFGVAGSIDIKLLSLFIMLNIYFNTWNQTIVPSLNMLNHRKSFVAFTLLTLSIGLACSVAVVIAVKPSAVLWLSGQLLAQAIMTMVAFLYFRKITAAVFDSGFTLRIVSRENFSYLLSFAFPLGVTTFFMWVQNQSYRMIVEKYLGLEFLGMIGLGLGVALSISAAVESLAQQVYYPVFYREINTTDPVKRSEAWDRMAQITIPIYLSVALMVSCLAPYLVKILVNEKFSQVWVFVIYGSWVEFCRVTTNILSSVAHSEMQTKSLIKAYFAGGLVASLGVYAVSGQQYYQQLIPAVLVLSGIITMAIMYADMKKLMRINVGMSGIAKSLFSSLPFALGLLFFSKAASMVFSCLIVAAFGIYFVSIQYSIYKSSLGKRLDA